MSKGGPLAGFIEREGLGTVDFSLGIEWLATLVPMEETPGVVEERRCMTVFLTITLLEDASTNGSAAPSLWGSTR